MAEKTIPFAETKQRLMQQPAFREEYDALEEVFGETHPGRVVRGLRKSRGLKQKELAAMLGVTPGNLSRMETGKRPIGKDMARRLGTVLGANYKTFL